MPKIFPSPHKNPLFPSPTYLMHDPLYIFSSIDTGAAWRPRLPDRPFIWEPVFSQFVESKFWPKKAELVLRHSYGQKIAITGIQ